MSRCPSRFSLFIIFSVAHQLGGTFPPWTWCQMKNDRHGIIVFQAYFPKCFVQSWKRHLKDFTVHPTCLIWGWMSRCRFLSLSCPPSRSSPCPAPSLLRRKQCPPETWRASGRRKGRRRICTRPGSWSGRGRCGWAMGSGWWGEREEAERPTDLRGGRGTGANVSIGRQRVRVRRREKEWAIGESKVIHQHASSEQDWNKEKTEIMKENEVRKVWEWSASGFDSESHAF